MRERWIERVSAAAGLWVGCDFDGTISPIVENPAAARADERCVRALTRLRAMARTWVAVVSGRPLAWLREATAGIGPIALVGSHGAEMEGVPPPRPPEEAMRALDNARRAARVLARETPGLYVEDKPVSVAVHYRQVEAAWREGVVRRAERLGSETGLWVRHGHLVVELCATRASKREAVEMLRSGSGAEVAVFFGDDETDEDAFEALHRRQGDVTVRVGPGLSKAGVRLASVDEVGAVLEELAARRWAAMAR